MITAIFATGTDGEFGLEGKLPWGSFPPELEAYKKAVISVLDQPFAANKTLLMGRVTWDSLPESAVNFLLSVTTDVIIVGRSSVQDTRNADIAYVTNLGHTLPPDWSDRNIVCIGGASVLNSLLAYGHIDKAIISTVYFDSPEWKPCPLYPRTVGDLFQNKLSDDFGPEFCADTFVPLHYFDDKTSILITKGSYWKPERHDKPLCFKQEAFFL